MRAVVFVTTNDSVTVDAEGRQAGGREWVVVDTSDDVTAAAIDRGQLRVIDHPGDGATLNPAAQAAFDALAKLEAGDPEPQHQVVDDTQQAVVDDTQNAPAASSPPAASHPRPRSRSTRRQTEGHS